MEFVFFGILVFIILLCLCGSYFESTDEKENNLKDIKARHLQEYTESYESILEESIKKNFDTLFVKFNQKVYQDDYGEYVYDDWDKEIDYFIENVALRSVWSKELSKSDILDLEDFIEYDATDYFHKCFKKLYNEYYDKLEEQRHIEIVVRNGIDYECYVEKYLENMGYFVKRTPKTGDQGVDLIAEKDGDRKAIQCKYYSKPVGNKAVQEVIAGRNFYQCSSAIVISNSTFTKSAKQLAENSGVELFCLVP